MRRTKTLNSLPKNSIGLEIGVWKGEFTEEIIKIVQPKRLYLLDPWIFQPNSPDGKENYSTRWYGGSAAKSQKDMDSIYQNVCNQFKNNANITIFKAFSADLPTLLPEYTLDWTYIDGNHSYDYVMKDLELSFKLVKENAMITGDDFSHPGVQKAVFEFHDKYKLHITNLDLFEDQFLFTIKKDI